MQNALNGGASCHHCLNGHPGERQKRRDPEYLGPEPKRRCSTRSKVAGIFTSGATAALIRESFSNQKGVVVSETALMPEDLTDISLEEVVFAIQWEPTVKEILPDKMHLQL